MGRLVRKDNPEIAIRGTIERLSGVALVSEATVNDEGRVVFEYAGETEIFWDEQHTVEKDGRAVWIDEKGEEVGDDNIMVVED